MVRELYTIAELARLNGVSERQADYAARQAQIAPAGRVGIIRVYDAQAAEQIAAALHRIGRREAVAR